MRRAFPSQSEVTTDVSKQPSGPGRAESPDSQLRRRNRDDPLRRETAISTHAASTAAASPHGPQSAEPMPGTVPGSVDDVLARGHAWLRFPKALETQFLADTLEPRRRLLGACGLIGIVGIVIGSANNDLLMPDIAELSRRVVNFYLLLASLSLIVVWFSPVGWRRNWHGEALTFVNTFGLCMAIIWSGTISLADTTFTHSATLIGPVMYACIAARQHFVWACTCAVLSLVGYVAFVHGHTPLQQLIVAGNTKLLTLSFAFVLVANYALEHSERRNWLLRKLEEQQRGVLIETSERLHRLSIQDPLTGLLNRRQFDADLSQAWSKAAFAKSPAAMLMLDVDSFKRYNDTYGHPAGDACLIQVAQVLADAADEHDGVCARLGGEEFGLLLPGYSLLDAMAVAEALCAEVRARRIEHRASEVGPHVTISVGVAQAWPHEGGGAQALMVAADRALYRAKSDGRDRACALQGASPTPNASGQPEPRQVPDVSSGQAEVDAASAVVPLPVSPALTPSPEAPFVHTLQSGFRWLRFPPEQEAAYRQRNAAQRRIYLSIMTVLGLLIYNTYVLTSWASFPDIRYSALVGQSALSAGMLVMTIISLRYKAGWFWRETLFSAGICLIAVGSSWILAQSRTLTALSFSVSLVMVPMFSGVGARQPFWFTCVPAMFTLAAITVLFKPVDPVAAVVFKDSVFMVANCTLYTLILAYTLEYGARKEWLFARIGELQREALAAASKRLHQLSMLDPLTGICNRRQFEDDFQRIWHDALHDRRQTALLIIDVDFFKLYNDNYGHPVGDRCLKQVAAAISQTAQAQRGLTARLGGEEFGVLLPGADLDQAEQLGEQICAAVRQVGIEHRHSPAAGLVTVSVGVASVMPAKGLNRRTLFATADDALYRAKSSGRNRVAAMPVAAATLPAVA